MRAAGGAHGGGVLPLAAAVVAVVVTGGRRRRGQGDELGHHVGVGGAREAVGPKGRGGRKKRGDIKKLWREASYAQ